MKTKPLLALLAIVALSSHAAQLQTCHVAADARWLLHWDFEGFLKSKTGESVKQRWTTDGLPEALAAVKPFLATQSLDDVKGITIYGSQVEQNGASMLIHAAYDKASVLADWNAKPGYVASKHGNHVLHEWPEAAAGAGTDTRVFAALCDQNTVVIAGTKATLTKALDVIDGNASRLSPDTVLAKLPSTPNTFLLARAERLEIPKEKVGQNNQHQAALLQSIVTMGLALSESDDHVKIDFSAVADTPQSAQQVQQFLQGLLALVMFQAQQSPELMQVIQGAQVALADKTVTLALQLPISSATKVLAKPDRATQGMQFLKGPRPAPAPSPWE